MSGFPNPNFPPTETQQITILLLLAAAFAIAAIAEWSYRKKAAKKK